MTMTTTTTKKEAAKTWKTVRQIGRKRVRQSIFCVLNTHCIVKTCMWAHKRACACVHTTHPINLLRSNLINWVCAFTWTVFKPYYEEHSFKHFLPLCLYPYTNTHSHTLHIRRHQWKSNSQWNTITLLFLAQLKKLLLTNGWTNETIEQTYEKQTKKQMNERTGRQSNEQMKCCWIM